MSRILPREVTTYDILKTLAVLLMIVDHIGYYLYPDENWFRVFGRMCVPMWFFLVGYARTRDLAPRIWIGAAALVIGNIVYGGYILPLSILATILIVRFSLDACVRLFNRSGLMMVITGTLLVLFIIPTSIVIEYGATGYILAMLGYFVRHRKENGYAQDFITSYAVFAAVVFILTQSVLFGFTGPQFFVLALGCCAVIFQLCNFEGRTLGWNMPSWCKSTLQFTGRRTLEIYVIHIWIFGIIAAYYNRSHFGFLDWQWISL